MNTPNTLIQIAGYLDLHSFTEFRLVNKKFYKSSNTVKLWKNHFFQAYFGDLSMFGDLNKHALDSVPTNYKDLCLARGKIRMRWMQLGNDLLTPSDLQDFINELFLTLKEPLLPMPMLRKEGSYYPTLFQDLIGNIESDLLNGEFQESVPVFESLVQMQETIGFAFMDSCQLHQFSSARWLMKTKEQIVERDSLNSQSTSADSDGPHLLIVLMRLLVKTIKNHCTAVLGLVKSSESGSFLSNYNIMWDAYSASIYRLQSLLSPLCYVVNCLYEQKYKFSIRIPVYSPVRIMGVLWNKNVLEYCSDDIIADILKLVNIIRQRNYKGENDINTIRKSVDCLIDLSVNEYSVSQIEHSQFSLSLPLQNLKSALLDSTSKYYKSLIGLSHSSYCTILSKDLEMLNKLLIPSILKPIKAMNHEIRLSSISNYYSTLYSTLTNFPPFNPPHPLLDTPFGQLLFSLTPSKQKIQHFLHYLSQTNNIEYVQEYNTLKLASNTTDKELEYKAQKTQPLSTEESILFSLSQDSTFEDFFTLLENFSN